MNYCNIRIGDMVIVLTEGGKYCHGFKARTIGKVTRLTREYAGVVGHTKYGDNNILQCIPYDEIALASLAGALQMLQ